MTYRIGRTLGRTVYEQVGAEPSKDDIFIGIMDTSELAQRVVDALNGPLAGRLILDPAEVAIVYVDGQVAAYEWTRP